VGWCSRSCASARLGSFGRRIRLPWPSPIGCGSQDVEDLLNRSCLEPGQLGVRKRKLLIINNKHPDAMFRNMCDLSPKVVVSGIGDLFCMGLDEALCRLYAFRGRDAPAQDCTPDGSSLSDQAAVLCVAKFRDRAAGMASHHRGDGQSRPAPGTARHPFLVV